tara:strand:- start:295 stop:639 length:345 start_codon:yes stop_codon:yes gene_type:complete
MNTNNDDEEHFAILRKIANKPEVSQRVMAHELGFSLGKLNYCLKALKSKGLVKIKRFKENKKKITYLYVLTPSGISAKTKITINFMKRMMNEYDELKSEIKSKQVKKTLDKDLL